jgi:hypothetical protein
MRLLRRFSAWLRLTFDVLNKIDPCGFGLCPGGTESHHLDTVDRVCLKSQRTPVTAAGYGRVEERAPQQAFT